jgi:hypothetical protein
VSYLAIRTFDLKNGSAEDYKNAYADLAKIGFRTHLTGQGGMQIQLPTTTTGGEFNGANASLLRDDLLERVRKAFAARGFTSEIFVLVGGDWAWGKNTT